MGEGGENHDFIREAKGNRKSVTNRKKKMEMGNPRTIQGRYISCEGGIEGKVDEMRRRATWVKKKKQNNEGERGKGKKEEGKNDKNG